MKLTKEERVCRLYLAMSEIDDRTATDALNYRSRRSGKVRFTVILAACLTLAIIVSLFTVVIADIVINEMKPSDVPPATLSELLEAEREKADDNENSNVGETVDLFNGQACIVWRYEDSDRYYTKELSESELKMLVSEIKRGNRVDENSSDNDCMVWLSYGNGEVVSPYLEASAGNIGYGVLFEYDPELEPSEAFVSSVGSIFD